MNKTDLYNKLGIIQIGINSNSDFEEIKSKINNLRNEICDVDTESEIYKLMSKINDSLRRNTKKLEDELNDYKKKSNPLKKVIFAKQEKVHQSTNSRLIVISIFKNYLTNNFTT